VTCFHDASDLVAHLLRAMNRLLRTNNQQRNRHRRH
jgi:hypothetical protein